MIISVALSSSIDSEVHLRGTVEILEAENVDPATIMVICSYAFEFATF